MSADYSLQLSVRDVYACSILIPNIVHGIGLVSESQGLNLGSTVLISLAFRNDCAFHGSMPRLILTLKKMFF